MAGITDLGELLRSWSPADDALEEGLRRLSDAG